MGRIYIANACFFSPMENCTGFFLGQFPVFTLYFSWSASLNCVLFVYWTFWISSLVSFYTRTLQTWDNGIKECSFWYKNFLKFIHQRFSRSSMRHSILVQWLRSGHLHHILERLVRASVPLSQFPTYIYLDSSRRWLKYFCHPHGRSQQSSGFLASSWPSSLIIAMWEVNQWNADLSASPPPQFL